MAITQRFGADDAILQLAIKAGKQDAFNTRFAQGQQLVQQAQSNQAQLRALELESQRLKIQADVARRAFVGPSTQQDRIRRNPLTRSVEQSAAQFKQPDQIPTSLLQTGSPGAGSVSGGDTEFKIDEQGNITGTQDGEVLSPQQIRQRGGFVQGQAPQGATTTAQTKINLVNQVPGLTDQERQLFIQTAGDEEESLSQFRNRLQQSRGKEPTPVSLGQRLTSQVGFIRQQVDDVEAESAGIERQLAELDDPINVVGMTMPEISLARERARREGDLEKAVLLRRALELREAKRQLRVGEQSLISGLIQPQDQGIPQADQPGAVSDPTQLTNEELRKIAGF